MKNSSGKTRKKTAGKPAPVICTQVGDKTITVHFPLSGFSFVVVHRVAIHSIKTTPVDFLGNIEEVRDNPDHVIYLESDLLKHRNMFVIIQTVDEKGLSFDVVIYKFAYVHSDYVLVPVK